MNATPPEANTEYSRAAVVSGGVSRAREDALDGPSAGGSWVFSAGILGLPLDFRGSAGAGHLWEG